MEGPTPVSALIHAATMVTAGVFMVARLSPLFELAPVASAFVTFIGATTAIFAATIRSRSERHQAHHRLFDLFAARLHVRRHGCRRVLGRACSTCSRHAFFKALLFLGSGSVILAMHHEQDIRNMGGLWRKIPFTYSVMIIGTLALTGFPLTAGYFSKDKIIEARGGRHQSDGDLRLHHDGRSGGADVLLFVAADLQDLPRHAAMISTITKRPMRARRSC